MRLSEQLDNAAQSFTSWIIVTLGGGLVWLIRRVLTNQRQIEILESRISHEQASQEADMRRRDEQRAEDRAMVRDIGKKVDALYERSMR